MVVFDATSGLPQPKAPRFATPCADKGFKAVSGEITMDATAMPRQEDHDRRGERWKQFLKALKDRVPLFQAVLMAYQLVRELV
jgi:hypothetical protein